MVKHEASAMGSALSAALWAVLLLGPALAISLPGFMPPIAWAQTSLTVEDIAAAISNSDNLLQRYELNYTVKRTFFYETVREQSGVAMSPGAQPPKTIAYVPVPVDEPEKQITYSYSYKASEGRFAFECDLADGINNLSQKSKHAFDGQRHLHFSSNGGESAPQGAIGLADQPNEGINADQVKPDAFFSRLDHRLITDWLTKTTATLVSDSEQVGQRNCCVVECYDETGNQKARFWLDPQTGFRPARMVCYHPNDWSESYEILEMKQAAEGVWFPTKATMDTYLVDPATQKSIRYSQVAFEADLNTLAVNAAAIPDDAFAFEFPIATMVSDLVTRRVFTVGGTGASPDMIGSFVAHAQSLSKDPAVEIRTGPETVDAPTRVQAVPYAAQDLRIPGSAPSRSFRHVPLYGVLVVALVFVGVVAVILVRRRRGVT